MLKTPTKQSLLSRRSGSMLELNSPKKGLVHIQVDALTPAKIFQDDMGKDCLKINFKEVSAYETCAGTSAQCCSEENKEEIFHVSNFEFQTPSRSRQYRHMNRLSPRASIDSLSSPNKKTSKHARYLTQATFRKDMQQYENIFKNSECKQSFKYDYFYGPYDEEKHSLQEKKAKIDKKSPLRFPDIKIRAKPQNDLYMKFNEPQSIKQPKYEPLYTLEDAKLEEQYPYEDSKISQEKFQTWDKIGNVVLNQLKHDNFDQYCKLNNKNYYLIRDKYVKLAPKKMVSRHSSRRSSRSSSRASNYGSRSRCMDKDNSTIESTDKVKQMVNVDDCRKIFKSFNHVKRTVTTDNRYQNEYDSKVLHKQQNYTILPALAKNYKIVGRKPSSALRRRAKAYFPITSTPLRQAKDRLQSEYDDILKDLNSKHSQIISQICNRSEKSYKTIDF